MNNSHKRPVSCLNVSTQFENIGDVWLYRELLQLISARSELFLNLSRCPPEFIANLDLQTTAPSARICSGAVSFSARILRERVRGRRVFYFLSPGGYHGEIDLKAWSMAWLRTAILRILTLLGVRVCLTGVSYERIGSRNARMLAIRSRLLAIHLVRDTESLHYAATLGMKVHGLMPDLSFGAIVPAQEETTLSQRKTIALSFRTDQYGAQLNDIITFLRALVTRVSKKYSWKIVVQVQRDAVNAESIADCIRELGKPVMVELVHSDFLGARAAYSDAAVVIGNRLHSLLLGASVGSRPIPVIDAEYNQKILRSFSDLGLARQIYTINNSATPNAIAGELNSGAVSLKQIDIVAQSRQLEDIYDRILGDAASWGPSEGLGRESGGHGGQ